MSLRCPDADVAAQEWAHSLFTASRPSQSPWFYIDCLPRAAAGTLDAHRRSQEGQVTTVRRQTVTLWGFSREYTSDQLFDEVRQIGRINGLERSGRHVGSVFSRACSLAKIE